MADETNDPIYITIADSCPAILDSSLTTEFNGFHGSQKVTVFFKFDDAAWNGYGNRLLLVKTGAPADLTDATYNIIQSW